MLLSKLDNKFVVSATRAETSRLRHTLAIGRRSRTTSVSRGALRDTGYPFVSRDSSVISVRPRTVLLGRHNGQRIQIECTHRCAARSCGPKRPYSETKFGVVFGRKACPKKRPVRRPGRRCNRRFPAEDPPLVAALVRGILDPPHSPQTQEEITQIWFAVHVLQALSLYRDLPSEQQPWARYRISTDRTFNLLARLHTQSLYDPLEISP